MKVSLKEHSNAPEFQKDNDCTMFALANAIENRLNQKGINIDINDTILGQFISVANGKVRSHVAQHGINMYVAMNTLQRFTDASLYSGRRFKIANPVTVSPVREYIEQKLLENHSIYCGIDGSFKMDYKKNMYVWNHVGSIYHAVNLVECDDDGVYFENSWKDSPIIFLPWTEIESIHDCYVFDIVEDCAGKTVVIFKGTPIVDTPIEKPNPDTTVINADGWKHNYYEIMKKEVPEHKRVFNDYESLSFTELMTKSLIEIANFRQSNL